MTVSVLTVPGLDFELPNEILVIGLVTGLTYALFGVGLVVTYRSTRVLNFAYGAMGALAATLTVELVQRYGWNYWPALAASLGLGAAAGAFMEVALVRPLARASRLVVLVATIGAAQLFVVGGSVLVPLIGGDDNSAFFSFPTPFSWTWTVGDLRLGPGHLLILLVTPAVTVGLAAFFRLTTIGIASRAAADNEDAARLAGIPVRRVSLAVWTLAGVVAAVSAILLGGVEPSAGVSGALGGGAVGTALLLSGLAAAMIGGLEHIGRVFVAGVILGGVEALVRWNYPTGDVYPVVLFVLIVVSLLLRRDLTGPGRTAEAGSWSLVGALRPLDAAVARLPTVRVGRGVVLVVVLAVAVFAPLLATNATLVHLSTIALFAAMGLSLVVLTGFTGQVSLGQVAFVGLGALVGGRMYQLGIPVWVALPVAAGAGALAALLVGLPALRVRGLQLAVTTLAFATMTPWLYGQDWLVDTGAAGAGSLELPRGRYLGIDFAANELRYYWLCIAVLVVLAVVVHRVRASGAARAMWAVRDNESNAADLGTGPGRTKLMAFMLSGAMAAVAGWFYGGLLVTFRNPGAFTPDLSLTIFAVVVLGGVSTITGAVLGAVSVRGLALAIEPHLPDLVPPSTAALLVGGVGIYLALLVFPGGIAGALFALRDRLVARLTVPAEASLPPGLPPIPTHEKAAPAPARSLADDAPAAVEARGIVVRYGGNVALDDVSLRADPGEVVGVVGPNGAGKTTLIEVLSGHIGPETGRVLLGGRDITSRRPAQRARLGLGRSHQQGRLFDEMRLVDVVTLALDGTHPVRLTPSVLGLPPTHARAQRKQQTAAELLDRFGLEPWGDRFVVELSTGTRRVAELACLVAMEASVLLLDEPTAGLAQREAEAFAPLLREVRDDLGAAAVVIEHDVEMVADVADRLCVLVSGRIVAEGAPSAVLGDLATARTEASQRPDLGAPGSQAGQEGEHR